MALFVRTSGEDITGWNRRKIVDALIREAGVDLDTAEEISREVEDRISGVRNRYPYGITDKGTGEREAYREGHEKCDEAACPPGISPL